MRHSVLLLLLLLPLTCSEGTGPSLHGPLSATINGAPWQADPMPGDTIGTWMAELGFYGQHRKGTKVVGVSFTLASYTGLGSYSLGGKNARTNGLYAVTENADRSKDAIWYTSSGNVTITQFDQTIRRVEGNFQATLVKDYWPAQQLSLSKVVGLRGFSGSFQCELTSTRKS